VTDKKGDHVENLTENDFELTVDGKRQTLTHFALVKLPEPKRPEPNGSGPKSSNPSKPPTTMPGKSITPEAVKRTIAFVMDDLGLSFESASSARLALKKFVDEQMQEGDLVGIIRTGGGYGALQQFTSDKRILYAAIDKLTWNPNSRNMRPQFKEDDPNKTEDAREAEERFEDFRETSFAVGTMGTLSLVAQGLRELPGRKVVILVSDGFRLFGRNRDNTQVLDNVRKVIDLANRSSIVIYSLDAKGLQTLMPGADVGNISGQRLATQMSRASQDNFESQEGLNFLARETGGFAVFNNNDINLGIQKALHDTQSYYLLGFDPEDEKFDKKYHSIKLKVKKPDTRVRTRAGFLGVSDRPQTEAVAELSGPEARNRQILSALFSPFGARELPLQMTSFFFNAEPRGPFVLSIFNIDASRLTFVDDPQVSGQKKCTIDIASFTFNAVGAIIDQHARTFTLHFNDARYKLVMENGLSYTDEFVVQKPGAYQFRTVLRDSETGRLGSAGQFIQVPDLSKKRLALSGLVLAGQSQEEAAKSTEAQQPPPSSDVNSSPAIRRFSRNSHIDYGAAIYNAVFDPQSGKSQLTMQVEIYRDGKSIFQSPPRPIDPSGIANGKVQCQGRLKLLAFPPGDFMMHLIVTDALANQKYARADQWMDFSVR